MSANHKGNLTVGGSAYEKSKMQMRRPTPDSDAMASSDDDREHVSTPRVTNTTYTPARRPSSGWLQDIQPSRKYSLPSASLAGSQPTTPSLDLPSQSRTATTFPWNTNSFTSNSPGTRVQGVLPSPTSAQPGSDKAFSSPGSDSDETITIGFLLNQQNAVRKAVRSQSYSVGQVELESPASASPANARLPYSLRHRPSKPSLLGEPSVGLAQLREDDIDEVESSAGSEGGIRLQPGYWERENTLLKQAAEKNARRTRATSSGSPVTQQYSRKVPLVMRSIPGEHAVDEHEDIDRSSESSNLTPLRRFSEHVAGFGDFTGVAAPDWSLNQDALSRRHSIAHHGTNTSTFQPPTLGNTQEEEEEASPLQSASPGMAENFDHNAYFSGYGPASRAINASAISAAHPDPPTDMPSSTDPYPGPGYMSRPGRRIYVVTFKCSRADIFYTYDNTGLEIRRGDLVICEGDRGVDLGQVIHADITQDEARKYKATAIEEHLRWLVMFSQYSVAGTGSNNPMLGALARAHSPSTISRPQLPGMGAQQDPDAKPKMIKRLAQAHEIKKLRDKEGDEAKAKRLAVAKTADHGFPMEILDAEFQADHHKITFFYYAESYVNFNPLVADLFKHYKIRIWMSAVNPASVINPAGLAQIPPPSAIGPGAILHSRVQNPSLSVGPGFGHNSYRASEQNGGRSHGHRADENYQPFAHQVPQYSAPQGYQSHWGQAVMPNMFGQFGFPNTASPGNYGAWYPPTTYASTPAAYGGGYPATTSAAGPSYGQYPTTGMQMPPSFHTAGSVYGTYASAPTQRAVNPSYGLHVTSTSFATTSGAHTATSSSNVTKRSFTPAEMATSRP